jgi:hypothetical protein
MKNAEFVELIRAGADELIRAGADEHHPDSELALDALVELDDLAYFQALVNLAAKHTDEEIVAAMEAVWPEKERP